MCNQIGFIVIIPKWVYLKPKGESWLMVKVKQCSIKFITAFPTCTKAIKCGYIFYLKIIQFVQNVFLPPTPKKDMAKRGNLGSFPNWLQSKKTFKAYLRSDSEFEMSPKSMSRHSSVASEVGGWVPTHLITQIVAKKSYVWISYAYWWYTRVLKTV